MVGSVITIRQALGTFATILSKLEKVGDGKIDFNDRDLAIISAKGSVIRMLKPFILEPEIIISKSLRSEKIIDKLIEMNINYFTAIYIQAFKVLVNVYGFENSNAFNLLSSSDMVMSQHQMELGSNGLIGSLLEYVDPFDVNTALEADTSDVSITEQDGGGNQNGGGSGSGASNGGGNGYVRDSVGINRLDAKELGIPQQFQKTMEIEAVVQSTGGGMKRTIKVEVSIKPNILYVDSNDIVNLADVHGKTTRLGYRLDQYRAGAISLGDLVFAQDLIQEHRKKMFDDKKKLISYMNNRTNVSNRKVVTQNALGFSRYYSVLLVTAQDKAKLDYIIGGNIFRDKYTNMLMERTKSMLFNVVDTLRENVHIFTKDLKGSSDLSYKYIEKALKKSETSTDEMAEIFKALMENKAPTF